MKKEGYCALLLLSFVFGLSLASVLYVYYPFTEKFSHCAIQSVDRLQTKLTGTLFPLILVFFLGFCSLRLPFVLLILSARTFCISTVCYLGFSFLQSGRFCILLLVGGLKLLLFSSFCRLTLLFGSSCRAHPGNTRKFCLQFVGDFLFVCGISSLLCIL